MDRIGLTLYAVNKASPDVPVMTNRRAYSRTSDMWAKIEQGALAGIVVID